MFYNVMMRSCSSSLRNYLQLRPLFQHNHHIFNSYKLSSQFRNNGTTAAGVTPTILESVGATAITTNPGAPSSPHLQVEPSISSATSTTTPASEGGEVPLDLIPPPPELPLEFEPISSLASSTTSQLIYNAAGEPTFASIGLGSWWPPGLIQSALEFLHINMGLPWWVCIVSGTIVIRLLLFPLVVKSQKNAAHMANNMPQLAILQAKMTTARQSGDAYLAAKLGNDMVTFMREKDISPFKSMLVPLAMAPVFLSVFIGLRKMANLPVESMREGGILWFVDLTLADPFYLLPLITSTTLWITLELGADGVKMNATQHGNLIKYAMRIMPIVIFPLTMNFPAALLCYWVSTNTVSLCQVGLLKIPAVRAKLGIPQLMKHKVEDLPTKKGLKASVKDSWTNMKITREVADRERYDEVSFKRAGSGPVPRTFKYDPTATKPSSSSPSPTTTTTAVNAKQQNR